MKKIFITIFGASMMLFSCSSNTKDMNPLLAEFNTPFEVPPFDQIQYEHYLPAFKEAMKMQMNEINDIISDKEAPTFENTIAALDYSGEKLSGVSSIFYNIKSANTSDEMQEIAKDLVPLLSSHRSSINLNPDLFERVKSVYDQRDGFDLTDEQSMLLEKTYKRFLRSGALLDDAGKAKMKEIDERLSMLSLQFGENLLKETNNYKLVIEEKKNLAGLPEGVIAAAAEAASEEGMEGKWLFTLHKPSWIPFLTYSEKRELREDLYKAMYNRGNNGNEFDNKDIIEEMVNLRIERANLLGYDSHADFVLEERMAKNSDNVNDLLMQLWTPAIEMAKNEAAQMQEMINKEGGDFKLASWDWWFYAEKIRMDKYNLDENVIREYFSLESVRNGIFHVIKELYGVTFEKRDDIPVYHEDVIAYELKNPDGSHLGIQYMDFYPRPGKQSGAWSTSYRKQQVRNGENITTVGSIVCNFSKPSGENPALLSFDEALTFYHEMGHAIHGQFSECTYPGISGTSVPTDFVELPSQIMENWGSHPDVLKYYAKHYKTGEPIPDELLKKIEAGNKFNTGFETSEYLAASMLDIQYHSLEKTGDLRVNQFEKETMDNIGLIDQIIPRYKSTYFSHVFSGGYSAGYYSYIWSGVLDKDAFKAFEESGDIFNPQLAESFRKNILSNGGKNEPMDMYVSFRGKEPDVSALLEARGLN